MTPLAKNKIPISLLVHFIHLHNHISNIRIININCDFKSNGTNYFANDSYLMLLLQSLIM